MSNFTVDYNDERFKQVESDKQSALTENDKLYDGMISQSDGYYNKQIQESKNWAEKQQQIQQEQTDFAIEQIEQQKEQSKKEYTAEQSASYVDYQKQSNKFGAEAEQMAAAGLSNTGFSESSKVSMYNAYQNRVAVARQSYNQVISNYNNSIKEAQLQNSSALAEITYRALQEQSELLLQQFRYKNQLLAEKEAQAQNINNTYYNRYQNVLAQINYENEQREQQRRYQEEMALQKQQMAQQQKQYEEEMALQKAKLQLEKIAAEISKQQALAVRNQEEDVFVNTSAASGNVNTTAPKSISGYGELTRTKETYYVDGVDAPIYATSDGTWWYWNWKNSKWTKIGKDVKKPDAVKRQDMLNKVMNSQKSTSILPALTTEQAMTGVSKTLMDKIKKGLGF